MAWVVTDLPIIIFLKRYSNNYLLIMYSHVQSLMKLSPVIYRSFYTATHCWPKEIVDVTGVLLPDLKLISQSFFLFPRLREHFCKMWRTNYKNQRLGKMAMKLWLLNMMGSLNSWTHSSCCYWQKTLIRSKKSVLPPEMEESHGPHIWLRSY